MKVYIGKYKNWFGPYQLAELLCFWAKDEVDEYGVKSKPDWVHKFGEWLAHGYIEEEPKVGELYTFNRDRHNTWLYKLLLWIESKRKRTVYVKIDRWDTWSADHTLALIILPLLKKMKDNKNGSPYVDDEDVPEHLKSLPLTQEEKDTGSVDTNHHLRWEYVLDEIIFAFENIVDDSWQDDFFQGQPQMAFVKHENGLNEIVTNPDNNYTVDRDGMKEYQNRITNGLKLFGKYYQALWT